MDTRSTNHSLASETPQASRAPRSPCCAWVMTGVLLSLTAFDTTLADTVSIPIGAQGTELQEINRPQQGMTATAVQQAFGAPIKQSAPVGNPPISRWYYEPYVVYFENDRVIHTVLKRTKN
ncbi:MAG: hypothetical protein P8104_13510 [Gammaproteobacteria bacterium]|jgi:hypothetical protein